MRHVAVRAKPILLRTTIGVIAVILLLLLALAAFPVDRFRPALERILSAEAGTAVRIARITRDERFTLSPRLRVEGVEVAQQAWVGKGDWAEIDEATFRLPLLPALIGRFHPRDLVITGLRLDLVRRADGRSNWSAGGSGSGTPMAPPVGLRIEEGRMVYRDAKRRRTLDTHFATDPAGRLQVQGSGVIVGHPVRVAATAAAVAGVDRPWPFSVALDGPGVRFHVHGVMDHAFDSRAMTIDIDTQADDLKTVDAIIESGLFHTQKIDLRAHARHERETWAVSGLSGTIGRSRISGSLTVAKRGDRHRIDGQVVADPLDFADLASMAHLAHQAELKHMSRQRLIPGTKVDLTKLAHTDGMIRLDARRMLGADSPPIRTVRATITLERSLLTVAPLHIGLVRGDVTGSLKADQRGRSFPFVTIDLALRGSDLAAFDRDGRVSGSLDGQLHLAGPGRTIAAAVARADGMIRLRARNGMLPAKVAALLAFDAGRALTRGRQEESGLRCAALDIDARAGTAAIDRLLIDTTASQTQGSGTIDLRDESLHLILTGQPKKAGLLQLPAPVEVGGTLADPHIALGKANKSAGAVFKSLGRAIAGRQPVATDFDCAMLGP